MLAVASRHNVRGPMRWEVGVIVGWRSGQAGYTATAREVDIVLEAAIPRGGVPGVRMLQDIVVGVGEIPPVMANIMERRWRRMRLL